MAEILQHRAGLFGSKIELHMAPEGLTLVGRKGQDSVEYAALGDVTAVEVAGIGRRPSLVVSFGALRPAWSIPRLPRESARWAAAVIEEGLSAAEKREDPQYGHRMPLDRLTDACAELITTGAGHAAVDVVDLVLMQGIHHGASDVHFDPYGSEIVVRYRIDGVLQDVARLDSSIKQQLTARLKVVSRLATFRKAVAQEGRARVKLVDRTVDLRFSALPTIHGEKVAVRIFDPLASIFSIEALGMSAEMLESFEKFLVQPQGTVLLTGPAGSGKTTTMYAALEFLRANRKNLSSIATVEDPVEYDLQVVNQTQVNAASGLTFANALRTVLRQDPEVIMIGEIRDSETAEIAVQAGLTGHMILSTVHARSAAGVLLRLIDLGVEPYLLASSVTAVLSQRLVRRVCQSCARDYVPTEAERQKHRLRADQRFVEGGGCEKCGGTGYSGRVGIFQLMPVSEAMREMVLRRSPLFAMEEQVESERIASLADDGVSKAGAGLTTLEELDRVLG